MKSFPQHTLDNPCAGIFDLDDTLAETQELHARAESELLAKYGVFLTPEEITFRYSGIKTSTFFQELLEPLHPDLDIRSVMNEKWSKLYEYVDTHGVNAISGVHETLADLKKCGYTLAIGSASPMEWIKRIAKVLELEQYFDAYASAHETERGKPFPDLFLLAAERIAVPPERCFVVDDAISGAQAARAAGMYSIMLVHPRMSEQLAKADEATRSLVSESTDHTIRSLKEISTLSTVCT